MALGFELNIIADSQMVCEDKVIFLVIGAIDVVDDFLHPGSASRGRGLRIAVCQVDHDVFEDAVDFNSKVFFDILNIDFCLNVLVTLEGSDSLFEYGLHVEHYILGSVLFGFLFLHLLLTQQFKGHRNHIAAGLHQEFLHVLHDIVIIDTAYEVDLLFGSIEGKLQVETKVVFKNVVSRL